MTHKNLWQLSFVFALGFILPLSMAYAEPIEAEVHSITADGVGNKIGTLTLSDTAKGLSIKTDLSNLPPGEHGFHLHENPSCDAGEKDGKLAAGIAAGGHFDPAKTGKHLGPQGKGHKGDLPALTVDSGGAAQQQIFVPYLKLADVRQHAIIIHAKGDNYKDTPEPLGGGGGRIACAIIP